MRKKMVKELEKVYAFLDTIKPEVKMNGVVEAISTYLLTDPRGIELVQCIYSGMPLERSFQYLKLMMSHLSTEIQKDEFYRVKMGKGLAPIDPTVLQEKLKVIELPVLSSDKKEKSNGEYEETEIEEKEEKEVDASDKSFKITASDVEFIETAGIKKADYDWYTFSGLRKKKFKYANKEYIVAPGGIVGIGKNKDLQGKHSCCIFDANNKDTAIQLRSKDVNTFLKRCKPFEGDVEAVFNPNPTGHRVAVG